MKIDKMKMIISVMIPLAIGGLGSLITKNNMDLSSELQAVPFNIPQVVFPIVWTILYILMGIACYIVITQEKKNKLWLVLYGAQLIANFVWTIVFFNLRMFDLSFAIIILLLLHVYALTILGLKIKKPIFYLFLPYSLWVTFATYLNYMIMIKK